MSPRTTPQQPAEVSTADRAAESRQSIAVLPFSILGEAADDYFSIGISEDMVANLKNSMQNIDVEEYLNTAREYLKTTGNKATTFTKENPGKIAAGVAVLAVGAGLLISSLGDKRR